MKFKTAYDPPKKVVMTFKKPSLTDAQYKQECDIGFIVENYAKLGKSFDNTNANYHDCTSVKDFQEAQMLVAECKSNFELLPAKERDRFKTVENYLEFISNAANLKESYEKGYIDRGSVDLSDIYPELKASTVVPETIENTSIPEGPVEASEKSG